MGKIAQNKKAKEEALFRTAFELFTTKGIEKTTISDIVEKAGVAKGTFYLYFKDKHDLMDRIIIRKGALVLKYVLEELKKTKEKLRMPFPEQMVFITDRIVDYLEKHKEIITLIGKNFSSCLNYFTSIEDDELKAMIDELVEENSENGFSEQDTLKRIYLIVTLVGSVCYDSLVFESPFGITDMKPILFASVKNIISEKNIPQKLKGV